MSETDANADLGDTPQAGSRRKLIIIAAAALLVAGGAAAWFGGLLGAGSADAPAKAQLPPIYHDIDSNLIVNFQGGGRVRFLQLGVQAMTRDPAVVDALQQHHPVIRNNLILLFSEQTHDQLITREGKAALAEAALAEVRNVLAEAHSANAVEAIYFTTFVMQ